MSERDEHWGAEDEEVVRRLRDGKPRITAFELDRIKTSVMGRVRPSTSRRRSSPRFSLLVAMLTVGAMVAGTAGTIAAGNSSLSGGTGAAQSQYRPPKCNPRHEECTCPSTSVRAGRDHCVCPSGLVFAAGSNDCRCPNGTNPTDSGRCVRCPDGGTMTDAGRCKCPNDQKEVAGKCRGRGDGASSPPTTAAAVTRAAPAASATPTLAPVSSTSAAVTTVASTHSRTHRRVRHARRQARHAASHTR